MAEFALPVKFCLTTILQDNGQTLDSVFVELDNFTNFTLRSAFGCSLSPVQAGNCNCCESAWSALCMPKPAILAGLRVLSFGAGKRTCDYPYSFRKLCAFNHLYNRTSAIS